MQDETEQAQAYLAELQKLQQDQQLASLRTLAREFEPTLTRLPGLQQELERLMVPGDGIDYEALAARIEPALKQATHFLLELDALPAPLHQAPEIQRFIAELSATISSHTTTTLIERFRQRCEDVQTAQSQAEEAERRAREAAHRRAQEEAKRKAREESELRALDEAKRRAQEVAAVRQAQLVADQKAWVERSRLEEAERKAQEKAKLPWIARSRIGFITIGTTLLLTCLLLGFLGITVTPEIKLDIFTFDFVKVILGSIIITAIIMFLLMFRIYGVILFAISMGIVYDHSAFPSGLRYAFDILGYAALCSFFLFFVIMYLSGLWTKFFR